MTGHFDQVEIEIPCQVCGRKFKKTIGWIRQNPDFYCECGLRFAAQQFDDGIKQAEQSIIDLQNTVRRLNMR
jgi:hypothetical protein